MEIILGMQKCHSHRPVACTRLPPQVREIVKKSAKDVCIENTLKTYEEVWLSKMFELTVHSRLATGGSATVAPVAKGAPWDENFVFSQNYIAKIHI